MVSRAFHFGDSLPGKMISDKAADIRLAVMVKMDIR